jgi:hypothetical protein
MVFNWLMHSLWGDIWTQTPNPYDYSELIDRCVIYQHWSRSGLLGTG